LNVARALALIEGQEYVLPEHVKAVMASVVDHRLEVSSGELGDHGKTAASYISESVPIP